MCEGIFFHPFADLAEAPTVIVSAIDGSTPGPAAGAAASAAARSGRELRGGHCSTEPPAGCRLDVGDFEEEPVKAQTRDAGRFLEGEADRNARGAGQPMKGWPLKVQSRGCGPLEGEADSGECVLEVQSRGLAESLEGVADSTDIVDVKLKGVLLGRKGPYDVAQSIVVAGGAKVLPGSCDAREFEQQGMKTRSQGLLLREVLEGEVDRSAEHDWDDGDGHGLLLEEAGVGDYEEDIGAFPDQETFEVHRKEKEIEQTAGQAVRKKKANRQKQKTQFFDISESEETATSRRASPGGRWAAIAESSDEEGTVGSNTVSVGEASISKGDIVKALDIMFARDPVMAMQLAGKLGWQLGP